MTKEEYIDGIKNAKDRYEYYVNFDNIRAVKDFKIAELMHIGEQYLSDEEKSRVILTRPFAFNPENPSTDRLYYKSSILPNYNIFRVFISKKKNISLINFFIVFIFKSCALQ